MNWLRTRFRVLGGIAGAVSYADTGPYAGAPRNPDLRVDDERTFSTIRYATNHHIAYTAADTVDGACHTCGLPLAQTHELHHRRGDTTEVRLGGLRVCPACDPDSWLLRSQMSAGTRARDRSRRNVV
jgi:hypothetical protein